ncbi:MAG: methyltransferase [Aeriscardovia sp.]|nr:methyltransferase [Aeriscardovia sp.]
MFMAWQDLVGGRLKEDNRFSNTLVWNTFPLPKLTKDQKDRIIEGGAKVLEARAQDPDTSLADLYTPGNMSSDLKTAHEALDRAMDRVFSDKPLRSEEERQKALLEAYEKMTGEKEGE